MKKVVINSIIAASILLLAASCGTTSPVPEKEPEPEKKTSTARELKVIKSSVSSDSIKETPEELYAKKIAGIKISVVSSPKETVNGKPFSAPFIFKATKADGSAADAFDIAISYPDTKNGDSVSFGLATLTTDTSGVVTFVPATPSRPFNSYISAYPAGDVTNEKIAKAADEASVKAPFKVRTNQMNAGGTISILDFTATGKPIVNNSVSSSNVLTGLYRLGFQRIGNADFPDEILKDDPALIYKKAKNLTGNNSAFLIYGTVKYAGPVEQKEDGKYSLTLESQITCLNMKDGSVLYTTEKTASATEDKEWNCLPAARKLIADQLSEAIFYGL